MTSVHYIVQVIFRFLISWKIIDSSLPRETFVLVINVHYLCFHLLDAYLYIICTKHTIYLANSTNTITIHWICSLPLTLLIHGKTFISCFWKHNRYNDELIAHRYLFYDSWYCIICSDGACTCTTTWVQRGIVIHTWDWRSVVVLHG